MRIIAGTHRSRRLIAPPDERASRPITDRVKTALFDRLWSLGALQTGHALDLFAGVGSLGIEALSRGVERVTFVERDRSIRAVLERNLATLGLSDRATVLSVDALSTAWHRGITLPGVGVGVGLVFCDPPYRLMDESPQRVAAMLEALASGVSAGATLVLRTQQHTAAAAIAGWTGPESHRYGSMVLHVYGREG